MQEQWGHMGPPPPRVSLYIDVDHHFTMSVSVFINQVASDLQRHRSGIFDLSHIIKYHMTPTLLTTQGCKTINVGHTNSHV